MGTTRLLFTLAATCISLASAFCLGSTASAEDIQNVYATNYPFPGTTGELRKQTIDTLRGKKIGYVIIAQGFPLIDAWTSVIKYETAFSGMELVMQDGNFSPDVMTQGIASAIAKKVDVLIVQNFDIKAFSKQLKEAEDAGIYVIQLNMNSTYKTDAFVGADYLGIGTQIATDLVRDCSPDKGKSGKIAVVQGNTSASASFDQYKAAQAIFAQHPEIKVVSDQSAGPLWSSDNAKQIVAAALLQHPDLCAVYGMWDSMDLGSAAAIKEAGKTTSVGLYTSGSGAKQMCDLVESGGITKYYAYNSVRQGHDIMDVARMLLLLKPPVGKSTLALFSPISVITRDNGKPWSCFDEAMVAQH
jgi:ribose transport system substrate-binding protein